jgi:D-lyxose ketol-isomerase
MKRSQINAIQREADAFLSERRFHLPPFAYWSPQQWEGNRAAAGEIIERNLGWDITDWGAGDYAHAGLFLFTIRNGAPDASRTGRGKSYAEKILICDPQKLTPLHYHVIKMEDIINRGGGDLVIQLYNGNPDKSRQDGTPVSVSIDGVVRTVPAGGTVRLKPGESITLEPYCYHAFWAEGARTLVGEVSVVNDDATDNYFFDPIGRFPTIEEDEPPLYLLVGDYARFRDSR